MSLCKPEHDLARFYRILADLGRTLGRWQLKNCNGRMKWPARGVYFFFETGEWRADGATLRVVRVGTHAVTAGSKTTLWNRLSTYRGTHSGSGNHRGSIFRLWVGTALLRRDGQLTPKPESWGHGSSALRTVRDGEAHVEQAVSAYIGSMPFLWVAADDQPGPASIRRILESNAIALLGCASRTGSTADPPSAEWLGQHCPNDAVHRSGLWNVRDIDGQYDPTFLDLMESCASPS